MNGFRLGILTLVGLWMGAGGSDEAIAQFYGGAYYGPGRHSAFYAGGYFPGSYGTGGYFGSPYAYGVGYGYGTGYGLAR